MSERVFVDDPIAFTDEINARRKVTGGDVLLQEVRELFITGCHCLKTFHAKPLREDAKALSFLGDFCVFTLRLCVKLYRTLELSAGCSACSRILSSVRSARL